MQNWAHIVTKSFSSQNADREEREGSWERENEYRALSVEEGNM